MGLLVWIFSYRSLSFETFRRQVCIASAVHRKSVTVPRELNERTYFGANCRDSGWRDTWTNLHVIVSDSTLRGGVNFDVSARVIGFAVGWVELLSLIRTSVQTIETMNSP